MLDHLVIQHERKTLSISRSAHVLVGEQRFALANRIPLRRNMRQERNHRALQQMPWSQLAPLNLHEVLQVIVLPFMQALQTRTHWSIFLAS